MSETWASHVNVTGVFSGNVIESGFIITLGGGRTARDVFLMRSILLPADFPLNSHEISPTKE